MKSMKRYVATAVALGLITLGGCAEEAGSPQPREWDLANMPEVEGSFDAVALNRAPSFVEGTLSVEVDGGETAVISRRALDSAILVNGVESKDTAQVLATFTTVKKIVVLAKDTGEDEAVVLDFLGGTFGAGTVAGFGISVDLNTDTTDDKIIVRGTTANDILAMGADNALGINPDAFKDVELLNVESYTFLLAAGDDQFYAVNPVLRQGVAGSPDVALAVYGGAGNDTLVGANQSGAGANTLYGNEGNDTLTGGPNADTIYGGVGNDIITGGAGADVALHGEDGDDQFVMGATPDGTDTFNCGPGVDHLNYGSRAGVVIVDLSAGGGANVGGEADDDDTYTNTGTNVCENVTSGGGADILTGNSANNVLVAGAGNDTLKGGAGDDTLTGGLGNDTFQGQAGNDTLNGDDGNDTFDETVYATFGAGNDVVNGGLGTDEIDYSGRLVAINVSMDGKAADDGQSGETDNVKADVENIKGATAAVVNTILGNVLNNVITGGAGDDVLSGDAGNDTLIGKNGDDVLNGGAGDDVFDEEAADTGSDVFNGGLGVDLVDYADRVAGLKVTMGDDLKNDGLGEVDLDDNGECWPADEAVWTGGGGATAVNEDPECDNVEDADGPDNILGGLGAADDESWTGGGGTVPDQEDWDCDGAKDLVAEGDNDGVCESTEEDSVAGDVENIVGSNQADYIVGNNQVNNINGGAGADAVLSGLGGDDTIDGDEDGAKKLVCGDGNDLAINRKLTAPTGTYSSDCEAQGL